MLLCCIQSSAWGCKHGEAEVGISSFDNKAKEFTCFYHHTYRRKSLGLGKHRVPLFSQPLTHSLMGSLILGIPLMRGQGFLMGSQWYILLRCGEVSLVIVVHCCDGGLMMGGDGPGHVMGIFYCGLMLQDQTLNDVGIRSGSWEYLQIWLIRGSSPGFPSNRADLVIIRGNGSNQLHAGLGRAGCLMDTGGD